MKFDRADGSLHHVAAIITPRAAFVAGLRLNALLVARRGPVSLAQDSVRLRARLSAIVALRRDKWGLIHSAQGAVRLISNGYTWRDLAGKPISKLDDDACTRVRVILKNGIETQAIRFRTHGIMMNRICAYRWPTSGAASIIGQPLSGTARRWTMHAIPMTGRPRRRFPGSMP